MILSLRFEVENSILMMLHGLCAGFLSPADDYVGESLDLTRLLIRNPPATFLWKVDGNSMRDGGIFYGDFTVVDRSVTPADGNVVVATVHGKRSLKRLHLKAGRPRLLPNDWQRRRPSWPQSVDTVEKLLVVSISSTP
ncbi:hypothetical protein J8N08_13480 [Agrobacterium tumefaciens]|jgi:DNA polymerase V|uniref:LexA family protein n=1 Tax=Agrobacterium tumefaciens TaxID=358 RepID=UPI001BB4D770|nr:hypothetical protein J8N08_13480 [Agrobacterium tumefaciens]